MRKIFVTLFFCAWAFAATGSVSGTITSDGQGLPGANVSLIGAFKGSATDSVGNYFIDRTLLQIRRRK